MQSSATLGFLLLCALAPSITSTRIRSRIRAPDPYDSDSELESEMNCEKELSKRVAEIMDRISAYHHQCGLVAEKHVTYDDKVKKYFITEDAGELLCKESCRNLEEFATDAPDSSDLIRECRGHDLLETILMQDAYDAGRKACEEEETSATLLDNVEEDLGIVDNIGLEVDPEIVDVPVTSPKKEPDVKPVVEPVDIPGNSPVAPLKGNKIKQMSFEYELKGVLALRSQPTCDTLKKVFKVCDYKRTGKVYFAQIDNMLDKLDSEKVESMQLLKEIYEKVKKDPDTQPMTFKDWTFFKMGWKEATSCALEYATQS